MPAKNISKPSENKEDEIKEEFEILDFNKPDFKFMPPGYHEWRQNGPYLVCKSCEVKHAVYIGINKIMVGVDSKNYPKLKKR